MKKVNVLVVVAMCAIVSLGYEVKVGTVVCNPGKTVCVPVSLDDARGASFTAVRVAYDPQVLVVMKVEEGSLCKTLSDDFIVTADESAGIVSFALFGTNTVSQSVSGTLARLHFAVRDGTAGLYSDLAVAGVQFGDVSSVRDITVSSAVTTVNGMVRVMRETAEVARLENAEVIVADSTLGALALSAGDAIQASDAQTAITVSGAVTASGAIWVTLALATTCTSRSLTILRRCWSLLRQWFAAARMSGSISTMVTLSTLEARSHAASVPAKPPPMTTTFWPVSALWVR